MLLASKICFANRICDDDVRDGEHRANSTVYVGSVTGCDA